MRIKLHLDEAKYEKPIIVFHGTDASNIPSILKHGLLATKKNSGPWFREFKKYPWNPFGHTMASFNGVYLAEDPKYAIQSADTYNIGLIVAQINRSSFAVDEDSVRGTILGLMRRILEQEKILNKNSSHQTWSSTESQDEMEPFNAKQNFVTAFANLFDISNQKEFESFIPILFDLFNLYKERQALWGQKSDEEKIDSEKLSREIFQKITFKLGKHKNAEFNHLKAYRYPVNLGFSGKNRIIGILHLNLIENQMKLVYGNIPQQVLNYGNSLIKEFPYGKKNINEIRNPDLYELDEAEDIVRLILKKILSLSREDWSIENNQQVTNFVITRQDIQNILQTTEGLSEDAIRVKLILIDGDDDDRHRSRGLFVHTNNNSSYIRIGLALARGGKLFSSFVDSVTSSIAHELNHFYDFVHRMKNMKSDDYNEEVKKLISVSPHQNALVSIFNNIFLSKYEKLKKKVVYFLDIHEIRSWSKEVTKQMIYRSKTDNENFYLIAKEFFEKNNIEFEEDAKQLNEELMYAITHLWELYYNLHFKDEIVKSQ